jgi:tRNA modification GTPase
LSGDTAHVELRAEDLRRGAQSLGRLTGKFDAEHVLDQIFKRFCIGK